MNAALSRSPVARRLAAGIQPAIDPARLAIADLSLLPRLGFKGRDTIVAMRAGGVVVEPTPNRAFRQPDGGLCLVLSPGEILLIAALDGDASAQEALLAGWQIDGEHRTFPLLRGDSHACFAITGSEAPSMFAKLCGVDLRLHRFADLAIAQTSLAKISAIIVRADLGATPAFRVLVDSASADYCLACLLDAAAEFEGGLVEIEALRRMAAP